MNKKLFYCLFITLLVVLGILIVGFKKVLNNAALKTIMKANPYPPFPSELKRDELIFTVDLDFNLES